MDKVLILLAAIVLGIALLIFGGLLADKISSLIRHYVPGFWYEGETFLLWGIALWTMFAMGVYLLYLLTH